VITIRKAVIDSGPLLSALVLHYQRERGRQPSLESFLEEPLLIRDHQEQFLNLLASIREKLTTSHAIGEIQGLAKARLKLGGDDRLNFWRASVDLLTQWNLDEQLIRLLEMASRSELKERLLDIGIVDTGLIELAAQNGCVLITQDERTLAARAWTDGIDCRLVKQLIPQV
jgi:predicted nucleic acid-binding protein